jgi:MFS family permease
MTYSPVVGGFVAQYKSWRWTQWCILFLSVFCLAIALAMKETYKPIILKRRAKKRGYQPPEGPAEGGVAAARKAVIQQFVKPMHMLFTEVRLQDLV